MKKKIAGLIAMGAMLTACTSTPLRMQALQANQVEGKDYQVLGEAEGSSVGVMLFNIIPINQNDRFEKAYQEAVQSKGADLLLNPTIEERWYWAYLFNGYIFTVKGTAVKLAKK